MTNTPSDVHWTERIRKANLEWRHAGVARMEAEQRMQDAQRALDAAYEGRRKWREQPAQMIAAWQPILARLSAEIGTDFSLTNTGGGCMAIEGVFGPVRMLITDYGDGDLSHPLAGTGWWMGFYLPDAPWGGEAASIVGDPDARDGGDLIKFVAFAVAGFWRGERHQMAAPPSDHSDGIPRIEYGDA